MSYSFFLTFIVGLINSRNFLFVLEAKEFISRPRVTKIVFVTLLDFIRFATNPELFTLIPAKPDVRKWFQIRTIPLTYEKNEKKYENLILLFSSEFYKLFVFKRNWSKSRGYHSFADVLLRRLRSDEYFVFCIDGHRRDHRRNCNDSQYHDIFEVSNSW